MACNTYRPKSNRSCCQPDKASIPGVWLMDLVRVVVTELADDFLDAVVIVASETLAYEVFELQGSTLAFII
jgi:hypothetical protein